MEYNNLGKTGLQISRLSFGSWLTFAKQIESNTAEDCMALAYERGVNFFDNAEIYARGNSEKVMGDILKKMGWSRDSYILSTKVYFGTGGELKPTQMGLSRKHIVEGIEASLKRFQTDYVDLYFCHRPDKKTPIEETVWTMHNLIQQGKILYWGTSEWSAQEIMEAHMVAKENHLIGPVMEQPQYNMFVRDKVEVEYNQIYKSVGLGLTTWSPLASGVLTGKYNEGMPDGTRFSIEGMEWLKERALTEKAIKKTKKLTSLAEKIGMSMPQLAICWCLKNPNVSTVILGASRPDQLDETLKCAELYHDLDDAVMNKIENILKNKPDQPPF